MNFFEPLTEDGDIDVTMIGYACGTKEEEMSTAWESIKGGIMGCERHII